MIETGISSASQLEGNCFNEMEIDSSTIIRAVVNGLQCQLSPEIQDIC